MSREYTTAKCDPRKYQSLQAIKLTRLWQAVEYINLWTYTEVIQCWTLTDGLWALSVFIWPFGSKFEVSSWSIVSSTAPLLARNTDSISSTSSPGNMARKSFIAWKKNNKINDIYIYIHVELQHYDHHLLVFWTLVFLPVLVKGCFVLIREFTQHTTEESLWFIRQIMMIKSKIILFYCKEPFNCSKELTSWTIWCRWI